MEVRKVLIRKDGVKLVIVPKNSDIKAGDYVAINKLEEKNGRRKKTKAK